MRQVPAPRGLQSKLGKGNQPREGSRVGARVKGGTRWNLIDVELQNNIMLFAIVSKA